MKITLNNIYKKIYYKYIVLKYNLFTKKNKTEYPYQIKKLFRFVKEEGLYSCVIPHFNCDGVQVFSMDVCSLKLYDFINFYNTKDYLCKKYNLDTTNMDDSIIISLLLTNLEYKWKIECYLDDKIKLTDRLVSKLEIADMYTSMRHKCNRWKKLKLKRYCNLELYEQITN